MRAGAAPPAHGAPPKTDGWHGVETCLVLIGLVLGLLAASAIVIATQPTVLGLDLRGGTELVYQARPTPQTPQVTPDVDRAINIIRTGPTSSASPSRRSPA